jgi:hypothetical protein
MAENDSLSPDEEAGESAAGAPGGFVFTCPGCSESIVLAEAPANGLVECPACGAQFFAATDPDDIEADARAEAEAEAARGRREAELSDLRVRQVSTLRRSLIRTRSYFLTGAWGCVAAVVELGWLVGLKLRELAADKAAGIHVGITEYVMPTAESACLAAAVFGIPYFFRRARQVAVELKDTVMKDPETPPDLSTLGGGLEPWRGLDQMHEQTDSEEMTR